MASEDRVYLTFDDGPDPQWTPRILDQLAAAEAHATFFAIGEQARRHPALLRRIAAEGHEIGNHTFSHCHPWTMTSRRAQLQVRAGAEVLADILGRAARLYRPPHGRLRRCMTAEAQRCGERVVLWDLSAIDWGVLGRAARIHERLRRIRPAEVTLMHDGRHRHNRPEELTLVLPVFLQELRQRGLRAVALD